MKEIIWEHSNVAILPENSQVIKADIEDWNGILATNFGFPNLIPADSQEKLFHIAVGRNKDGDIVGAKLLEERVTGLNGSNHENLVFLSERAQRIFGIAIRSHDDS